MATEPVNPYAPSEALAHDVAAEAQQTGLRKRARWAAVLVAIFTFPFAGAGFLVLGLRRQFIAWMTVSVVMRALMIMAVWARSPKLCLVAIAAVMAAGLVSIAATAIAKPADAPVKRAWSIAALLIVAGFGASFAVRVWLVEAFQIPSGAMIPTLLVGDHIFVNKGRAGIARGDVIVFKFPQDHSTDYVKRVVAIGGDTIEVREGVPSINGVPLAHDPLPGPCSIEHEAGGFADPEPEPCTLVRETNAGRSYTFMHTPDHAARDFPRMVIPEGEVFVLGDNRDNSYDSRQWGTVSVDLIKGRATMIWWSKAPNGALRWSRVGRGVE